MNFKDNDSENKNEIRGSPGTLEIITNGSLDALRTFQYPNQLMKIITKDTQVEKGEITPLVMVINQSCTSVQEKVNALIAAGADPSLSFNYFGNTTTATAIANKHRPQIIVR